MRVYLVNNAIRKVVGYHMREVFEQLPYCFSACLKICLFRKTLINSIAFFLQSNRKIVNLCSTISGYRVING